MALAAGARLGPYEILSPLGAGGMGEVYRAHDTKLDRDVAIKILLGAVAGDPDRLARFSREAQLLAALNHLNIAHIHGVEESGGRPALVLELVEGPTLADRIVRGAIPLSEALPIARQIAEALEAAHEQGIVHRDLKPANIKVREDGTVKVLDFGLAKALDPAGASAVNASISPTISMHATQAGIILGTAAYMSPEQARGRVVDRRADIWAFGVVLFEMLTGTRAFDAEDISATLAFIITKDPDWSALPASTPTAIRRMLRRCLEKDPKRRLQSIGDARLELEEALAAPSVVEADAPRVLEQPSWRRTLPWAVASALGLGVALLLWSSWRAGLPMAPSVRFQIPTPGISAAQMFALSDDGRRLAFIASDGARTQVWVREMDTLEPHALAGTDGATYPFWSPDGGYLGFFAQGKLKKIAVAGGPPRTLCDAANGRGGTWNRDGVIVFSPGPTSPLSRVSAAGGIPAPVAALARGDASTGQRFPTFLPDGVHLLYTSSSSKPDTDGVYLATLEGDTSERLLPGNLNALYAPPATAGGPGYLVFRRQNTLMAQPFDVKAWRTVGEMRPLAEDVPESLNSGFGAFSVASNAIVYRTGGSFANRSVVWVDRAGKRLGEVAQPNTFGQGIRLSPDDTTAALGIFSGSLTNIWLQDLRQDTLSRFTFLPGKNPVWSPDGKRLAFTRQTASTADIYWKAAAGNGQEELLLHAGVNGTSLDWSPDGKWILYHQQERETGLDLWLLPLDGDRKPVPYLQTPSSEAFGAFSPDGRWVAFQSDETGRNQIYIQTMPSSSAKYQISTAGGTSPQWRPDGKELFYVTADGKLRAAPMALGAPVPAGAPHELFTGVETGEFALSRDGQRFLVNVPTVGEKAAIPPLTMVLNWTAGLKP